MPEHTQLHTKDATPPTGKADHDRLFWFENKEGTHNLIELKYHVWTVKGVPHDAYEIVGKNKSLSHGQVKAALREGILQPFYTPDLSLAA